MDITLDVGELYFGLNSVLTLEKDLNTLVGSLSSVSVSGELPSASIYSGLVGELKNVISTDVDDLIIRLENSKRILQENDAEAALLFNFFDQGIINGNFEFTDMPLLDQTDYDYIKYSQGTVATSGCGLTSLCMVASYFTGQLYTPDDLAAIANAVKTSNVDRMTAAADYLGLTWHLSPSTDTNDLKQYLSEGKVVICLVKNSSHFVVCKGITEDGQILVNDPYGPWAKDEPYSLSDLKMSCGSTWVFDPAENQHVRTEFSGDVVVEAEIVELLRDENGFESRVSEPAIVTLPADSNSNNNQSSNIVTLGSDDIVDSNDFGVSFNVSDSSDLVSDTNSKPTVTTTSTTTNSSSNTSINNTGSSVSSKPTVTTTSAATNSSSNASTNNTGSSVETKPTVTTTSTTTNSSSNTSTNNTGSSVETKPTVTTTSTATNSSSNTSTNNTGSSVETKPTVTTMSTATNSVVTDTSSAIRQSTSTNISGNSSSNVNNYSLDSANLSIESLNTENSNTFVMEKDYVTSNNDYIYETNKDNSSMNVVSDKTLNYSDNIHGDILSNDNAGTVKKDSNSIMINDDNESTKNNYGKYVIPSVAGLAVAGAVSYGIARNKKTNDSKGNRDNLDNSEEESYIL